MSNDEPLVDEEALFEYLLEKRPTGSGKPTFEVERIQEGKSNETFRITWGDDAWILRRPPRGAFLPTAHDVLREHQVLSALEGTNVRAPKPELACDDDGVIGAEFYLMEEIEGHVIRTELPPEYADDEAAHLDIGFELVDALTELHNVEWEDTPLAEIGYKSGYLERQVARWKDQWDRTREHTEDVREVSALDDVGAWLEDNLPETPETTVVHGDYKLDNVVFDGDVPELVGILDWEMATLGDPLADLGYMLVFWREEGDPAEGMLGVEPRMTEAPTFPTREELIERYEEATGVEAENLPWYKALAIWKLAILLEGSYARFLGGKETDPFFEKMEEGVPVLAKRAKGVMLGEREI